LFRFVYIDTTPGVSYIYILVHAAFTKIGLVFNENQAEKTSQEILFEANLAFSSSTNTLS